MHFKIIIPVYNSEDWIEHTLTSVLSQDYDSIECTITDDCSTDNTVSVIEEFVDKFDLSDYVVLRKNEERKYALYNIHQMIQTMDADDEDVIVCLDGDDWFYNENVLYQLSEIYEEEDCWLTYGSYICYPGGRDSSFHVAPYSGEVIESGDFRKDPQWRASHLRTFKYKLAKNIMAEDLTDEDGSYYRYAWDQAIMFPLMEMAREKVQFVSEILYVYNDANPINVHKVDPQEQIDIAEQIRVRQKKDSLVDVL